MIVANFDGRPTASPSASVRFEIPKSCTLTFSFSPVNKPSKTEGACTGSTKKQWTCSPNNCFKPNVIPPGAPPTPQGRYTNKGCSSSTLIFLRSEERRVGKECRFRYWREE